MSISSVNSNYVTPSAQVQSGTNSRTAGTSDPDGDGDGGRAHRGHRGGKMESALMQALQSMGLNINPTGTATSSAQASSAQSTAGADSDGDNDGSTGAASAIKKDLGTLMHSLFKAMRSESSTADANGAANASSATGGKPDFAGDLGKLITQVSSGQAPADLQAAFDQLKADMQSNSTTSTPNAAGADSTSAGNSSTTAQATLLKLLEQLQQNAGYGSSASKTASLGNIVNQNA